MFGLRVSTDAREQGLQLAAGRVLIAALMLAAPGRAARAVGADSATAARVTWLTRMLAVRDGALGAGAVAALRHDTPAAAWVLAGAVSDAVDAVVVADAVRRGRLRGPAPAALVAGAGAVAGFGAVTALRLDRRT